MKKTLTVLFLATGLLAACEKLQDTLMPVAKRSELEHITAQCLKDQKDNNKPSPCEYVDLNQDYAVLKDRVGDTQYLVIPTHRVVGIESHELLLDNAPNYWEDAWAARKYVFAKLGKETDRSNIGMAVNSPQVRSQDQLHIHIDCVKPEVVKALGDYKEKLNHDWATLPFQLEGHNYQAMRLYSDDLHGENPFQLLSVQGDMSNKTLVIIGTTFARNVTGFVLLSDTAKLVKGDLGSGEELLDHSCAVVK